MSLPHLLSQIGTYFQSLHIPNFCLGPSMTVEQQGLVPQVSFDVSALPNCPLTLIVVWFTRNGFVEGQNFLLINRTRQELERVNPFPNYFGSLSPNALIEAGLGGLRFSSLRPQDLPPALQSDYFSSIYYLQTRLLNPGASREDLLRALGEVSPELITRYRDQLLNFIPAPSLKQNRGLILCSGRDVLTVLPGYLPEGVYWTTFNTDLQSRPDIFGSYSSFPNLQQLGLFSWDEVYIRGCPVGVSPTEFQNIIRAGRWLLKRGGRLYIPNYYLSASQPGVVLSEAAQRSRQREAESQIERIRQEEFFSQAELNDRRVVFTA